MKKVLQSLLLIATLGVTLWLENVISYFFAGSVWAIVIPIAFLVIASGCILFYWNLFSPGTLRWATERYELDLTGDTDAIFSYRGKRFATANNVPAGYVFVVIFDEESFQFSYLLYDEQAIFNMDFSEYKMELYDRLAN